MVDDAARIRIMHVGGPTAVAMESDSLSDSTTECASLGIATE
jgi:hypothetical protein